jgi:hypothetical protein
MLARNQATDTKNPNAAMKVFSNPFPSEREKYAMNVAAINVQKYMPRCQRRFI